MLKCLKIQNFALIRELSLNFEDGLTVITGETGAGKSILLGALGLVMGKRADTSVLLDNTKKCIVESIYSLNDFHLQELFDEFDLDFDSETIIRREISPSGKSRAFINDTPVNLKILTKISSHLIDIHSQHQTLELNQTDFQILSLDAFALINSEVEEYRKAFQKQNLLEKELQNLLDEQVLMKKEFDYHSFLFHELENSNISVDNFEEAKEKLDIYKNFESIQTILYEINNIIHEEGNGLLTHIGTIVSLFEKMNLYTERYAGVSQRIQSLMIEMEDIASEIDVDAHQVEIDSDEAEKFQDIVDEAFRLQQKHHVNSVDELMEVKAELSQKLDSYAGMDDKIAKLRDLLAAQQEKVLGMAKRISLKRKNAAQRINKMVVTSLHELGMPDARFDIQINSLDKPNIYGIDQIQYLFSANKGTGMQNISKTASGGELSRLLLSLKSAIVTKTKLPTIIFDEIDTGISGEVARKMAAILQNMSDRMQLIAITHLPQIAAKGNTHLQVQKVTENELTHTTVQQIKGEKRAEEIAKMIGGEDFTEAALKTAKELVN